MRRCGPLCEVSGRLSDQDAGRGCGGLVLTAGCLANPSCCRPLAGSARGCRHPVRNRPGRLGACRGGPEPSGPSGAGRGCGDRCGRAQENPHPRGARRQRPKTGRKDVEATDAGHAKALHWALVKFGDDDVAWGIEDCRHVSARLERSLIDAGQRVARVPTRLMDPVP